MIQPGMTFPYRNVAASESHYLRNSGQQVLIVNERGIPNVVSGPFYYSAFGAWHRDAITRDRGDAQVFTVSAALQAITSRWNEVPNHISLEVL